MLERFPPARVLFLFFAHFARRFGDQFEDLRRALRGARLPVTYHGYVARTLIYAVAGSVLAITAAVGFAVLAVRPAALASVGPIPVVVAALFPGTLTAYLVYRARMYYPSYLASERARQARLSMPNVVNFMLALGRAGVPTREALDVVADNSEVLGTAAEEFRYAWRDMEYFGADVVTALRRLATTTALDEMSDFVNGYVQALSGRGRIDQYLELEMEDLFEQAEEDQEEFLSSLGVLAEVYVAVFVAGPVFTLIILVVMGFIGAPGIINGVRIIVYVMTPLTAVGYLILLDIYMTNPLTGSGRFQRLETEDAYSLEADDIETLAGDQDDQHDALDRYRRRQTVVRFLGQPLTHLRRNPRYALYLGVVLAVLYAALKIGLGTAAPGVPFLPTIPSDPAPVAVLRAVDATLVEAALIALATYTVFYELRSRYLAAVERDLPILLSELSDRHQIGMALSSSIADLAEVDMGRLDVEIERMARDVRLGSNAPDVLRRFANRVRSPVVTRVVVLLSAASNTAERLGPVIEALADRAELAQRLRRERRVEMGLYVVIIYISYLIFLVILIVLNDVFLPQVPTGGSGLSGAGIGNLGEGFDPDAYSLLFFHMAALQGLFTGIVGGKMSEGDVSAGAKHAFVMLVLAYLTFVVLLPNVTITV